jgi:hypothetical protein
MFDSNLYLYERMMAQRVKDEHRQAEVRRLVSEAQAGRASWLSQQRCRAVCQLGQFFVSLGQRLLQDASPQPFPLEDKVGGRA